MIFRPDSLRLGWWGGDASRNGADLFEIETDFSAKIVTFRLVGGMHPPHPPPLNPPLQTTAVHKFDAIIRVIDLLLRMCQKRDVSIHTHRRVARI